MEAMVAVATLLAFVVARVIAVRPRGEQMEITCVAEHSAVHSADGSVDSGTDPI